MHSIIHNVLMRLAVPTRLRLMTQVKAQQHWDSSKIQPYQESRLRKMIRYCWNNVPFYRTHWQQHIASPDAIQTLADLQKLPLLTKADVRMHYHSLMTTQSNVRVSQARTGGSTGQPVLFAITPFDEELGWALMYSGWYRAGYRIGHPFLVVGGESIGVGTGDRRTWKDFVVNRWVTSGSNLSRERVQLLAASPAFKKIRFIYGYPNAVRELGEWLVALGSSPPPDLRGIVCTAEVMLPEVRQRIKQLYGSVPVLDQWGLNDGGLQACESTAEDGFHVGFQRSILEIVDDAGQQIFTPQQTGRAIATSLTNFAFPFIRYETGDMVHWKSFEPSPSGVHWPRLGPIDGRTGDVIYLSNGRCITMPGLTLVMRWIDRLWQYQFIQTGPDAVTVRLDFGTEKALSETEALSFLQEKIGRDINWTVLFAPVEFTLNGKLLVIRNDWLRQQNLTRPTVSPSATA